MENLKLPILFTTIYLFLYASLPISEVGYQIMFFAFLISQFLIVWLVIKVLKDGIPSKETFDDGRWYEDLDYKGST